MDWPAAVAAIRARIVANWTATPIEWENENFTPPDGAPWVSIAIIQVACDIAGIRRPGDHRLRMHGYIRAEFLTPVGIGVSSSADLVSTFCNFFRLQTFDEIRAYTPDQAVSPGPTEDGMWWVTETRIPFYFDTFG